MTITIDTPVATGAASWRDDEVRAVGGLADEFFATHITPHRERFELQHHVDRDVWRVAGDLGLLCCSIPIAYGGGGGTIAHDLAVLEAQSRAGDTGFGASIHSGIVAHYLLAYGTEAQKRRWLPRMATGELIGAVAMTEPGAGSDLKSVRTRARREGGEYVIDGAKTFISNGHLADLVIVVAKTDPTAGARGISLLVVETADCAGFARGRIHDKIGQPSADTSELFFEGVRVPAANLLGEREGAGFAQLMAQLAQERLQIGVAAVAMMERAVALTVEYAKTRELFGGTLFDMQNTRFVLAECQTLTQVARVFSDSCVERHLRGDLDAATAAMAKWWLSDTEVDVVDRCLQLFGGNGYMREFPIARLYEDSRVHKIYGGANEVMKDLIARSL